MNMNISAEVKEFILNDAIERFLRYVRIWTSSEEDSSTFPSTKIQFDLGALLAKELEDLRLENVKQGPREGAPLEN